jgi:hypothetical protein
MKARRPITIHAEQGLCRQSRWWWMLAITALGAVLVVWLTRDISREVPIAADGSESSGSAREPRDTNGISVVVEGRELPAWEEDALRSFAEHVLSDVAAAVVNEALEQVARDLSLSDEIEKQLILGEIHGSDESVYSVFLTRPGDSARLPETAELRIDGHVAIRFVRLFARIERPTAIVVENAIAEGRPLSSERLLIYDDTGVWREVESAGDTE